MNNIITLIGARNAGRKIGESNERCGGRYTPATDSLPARFETTLIVNEYGPVQSDGTRKDYQQTYFITVWNGQNAAPGKGLADIFAKHFSVGKELKACTLARRPFEQNIVVNGQTIVNPVTGQPATHMMTNWRLESFEFGPDSAKLIGEEIAAWTGAEEWGVRPPCFDGVIRPDSQGNLPIITGTTKVNHDLVTQHQNIWAALKAKRNALVYQVGMAWYGYAQVNNASTSTNTTQQQQMDSTTNAGANTGSNVNDMITALMQNPALQANPTLMAQLITAASAGNNANVNANANAGTNTGNTGTTSKRHFAI